METSQLTCLSLLCCNCRARLLNPHGHNHGRGHRTWTQTWTENMEWHVHYPAKNSTRALAHMQMRSTGSAGSSQNGRDSAHAGVWLRWLTPAVCVCARFTSSTEASSPRKRCCWPPTGLGPRHKLAPTLYWPAAEHNSLLWR